MPARGGAFVSLCALAISAASAHAQSCLGYPAFATGPLNISTEVNVGSDYGGLSLSINAARLKGRPFAGVGTTVVRYVSDPKETRVAFGGSLGYEHQTKDQLILCPFVLANFVRGSDVAEGDATQRTTGSVIGAGIGLAFELERPGALSFNPFASWDYSQVKTHVEQTGDDIKLTNNGGTFSFGLGVRFRDAIQVTPCFTDSTFPGADLLFTLRISVSLRFAN